MGRDKIKTTELHQDHAANIRKLSNGNLKYFYDRFIRGEISTADFYSAMRPNEPITPQVEQVIDESYFEAIAGLGLTHEELDAVPSYPILLRQLLRKFEYVLSDTQTFTKDDILEYQRAFKFYSYLINNGLLEFKESKKAKAFIL